jgi:hypothetical protein
MNTRDKILEEIKELDSHKVAPLHFGIKFRLKDKIAKEDYEYLDSLFTYGLESISKKAKLEGYDLAQKEILEKIKKLWKEKCKRMKIMSGDVAIYELNNILDEIKGEKKE